MNQYFEITYRGVTASVEPANGIDRWEMCVKSDQCSNDWVPVGCGNYPEVSMDTARACAMELLKEVFYPRALREADAQLQFWTKRIAELKAQ